MARQLNRLSPRGVQTITKTGRHADGGGLYLSVGPGEARRWVFLYRWRGKLKEMGLGGFASVGLAKARQRAQAARELIADGIDPLEAKRATQAVPTFGDMADTLVADLSSQWRNEKHRAQWKSTLETGAAAIRHIRVDQVETADVLEVLKPIWSEKPETASRLRGRIERVLDAAKARGFRQGENPARWRGHLDHLLPKRQKLTRGHHAALPFADVPDFIAELRRREATSALALEFAIFTAARSGEVRSATWGEIDLGAKVWTVPAVRMKSAREHRVPLSARAVEILTTMAPLKAGDDALIFPGHKKAAPLSDAAFDALLERMERKGQITAHGFRSSFRDWAGEVSTFPRELAEAALAHVVGDETERAYRRGDALEKRRKMMDAWGRFCEPRKADNVRRLQRAG
ncbi:MAG TPA: integrase [Brevundimonas sp.]|jgi:integrase|nr:MULTISPECIES: site-specific integrase [unclassified Brevundimonas]MAL87794.1 integrase [Brevundimonas sp.]HAJ02299.1 integrase [Brevundimonas sp.]HAV49532.1 integrase [Brevundimonas sp.]|tara:strand:- start:2466 stop:3674 length:1209 start_codon:yes stop_codon:yes gene_type:complete